MVNFICKDCNYRFEANEAKACPYCNKECVEKDKSADELLGEVSDLLKD